jgi:hypothetical protein
MQSYRRLREVLTAAPQVLADEETGAADVHVQGYDVLLYPPTPATQPRSNKPTGRGDLSPIQWSFLGGKYINSKTTSTENRVKDIYI